MVQKISENITTAHSFGYEFCLSVRFCKLYCKFIYYVPIFKDLRFSTGLSQFYFHIIQKRYFSVIREYKTFLIPILKVYELKRNGLYFGMNAYFTYYYILLCIIFFGKTYVRTPGACMALNLSSCTAW